MVATRAKNQVHRRARVTARSSSRKMEVNHSQSINLQALKAARELKARIRVKARKARKMKIKMKKSDLQKIMITKPIKPKEIRMTHIKSTSPRKVAPTRKSIKLRKKLTIHTRQR